MQPSAPLGKTDCLPVATASASQRLRTAGVVLIVAALLAACSSAASKVTVYQNEGFDTSETFSRLFDASVDASCEAARRALLSQGYLLTTVKRDFISANKNFQPEGEVHVQIAFNVVCVPEGSHGKLATTYVNAIQDRYALKKNPNSATVGVSAIGSLSIPLTPSEDSLVKVASETIPAGPFYDRFFSLMKSNLDQQAGEH